MTDNSKANRYERIFQQLEVLFVKTTDPYARMASICALLHHKMKHYFWTGFYLLRDGELIVSGYQGPLACMQLAKNTGVCWAGINRGKTIIVPDVDKFPGHIACDSRSKSEIVVPLKNAEGKVIGVLDVDSSDYNSFDETDAMGLEKILDLVYS